MPEPIFDRLGFSGKSVDNNAIWRARARWRRRNVSFSDQDRRTWSMRFWLPCGRDSCERDMMSTSKTRCEKSPLQFGLSTFCKSRAEKSSAGIGKFFAFASVDGVIRRAENWLRWLNSNHELEKGAINDVSKALRCIRFCHVLIQPPFTASGTSIADLREP